ncbi:MAG TPA: NAD(P)H-dependent glycerol-3-phosphate dehydrogenase [Gemmatimonadaceae bacterium]|nr:NAD(P)H-dependent glycerol-3-phosphate dehydrogenase [Gemmatimonadaceae bacterium]
MNCAVIGAGAWGTALARVLAENEHGVRLWAHEPEVVEAINARRENVVFLPGAALSSRISASGSFHDAAEGADLVVFAAPSRWLRAIARASATFVAPDATLVVATKGIEGGSLALMTQIVECEVPGRQVVALSGPSFASEVAAGQPTAIVAASVSRDAARRVQEALSSRTLRVYSQSDVVGVELAGALKNVMAVATGIVEGVGLGLNSRAALITRGLAEMTRLGVALGAHQATFAGLAGMGDLILTCTGSLSRNRAVGIDVGRGASLVEALAGKVTVAEGVVTAQSARALARRARVDMPIVDMVNRILFEGYPARSAVTEMMTRELRPEQDP